MTTATLPPRGTDPLPPSPEPQPDGASAPAQGPGFITRTIRGRPADPAWVRPAVLGLLATTGFLYVWGLGASGWANTYYSAAVQAGAHSWKAFLFGSSDAANAISVDKAPAFLWPMEIAARIFGVNSWSILVPQALEGVAAVGLLYAAVRRWFTPAAGVLAGAVLATTPVAALMFRFNNPDAMLVLLLTGAAYAMTRALERAQTKWVVASGALVGFAFLAKMLQALLILPALGLVYLVAAPTPLRRRIVQLLAGGAALVASAGWWLAVVALTPASSRPYIGGSQNNSIWNLVFGYNGFGRLTGSETGSVGGGNASGRWGATGWYRLFNTEFGGQASWLLPAAVVLLAGLVFLTWRTSRTTKARAAMLLWGGSLLVTGAAISFGQGIIHPYYTVALAPAIGAIVGIAATELWRRRHLLAARAALATAMGATACWSYELFSRTPDWHPALRVYALAGGLTAAVLVAVWPDVRGRAAAALAAVALTAALVGPVASTWTTVTTPHSGAIPSAGPAGANGFGPGGGGGPGGIAGGRPAGGFGAPPTGAPAGGIGGIGALAGGIGGILAGSTSNAELTAALQADAGRYTWAAAAVSANQAAGYQLASSEPVMAIGGFNGTDPSPTLAEFQQYVSQGRIHYFIAGGAGGGGFAGGPGGPGGGSGTGTASQISSWVQSHYSATSIGGVTVYDLTSPPT